MFVKDELITYVLTRFPQSAEDNTEFCLRFWETACESRGLVFPEELKKVIKDYKPESIVRKRREFIEPTKQQREKQYQVWKEYHL